MINEVLDAPSDRSHPVKRNRPVPSGLVSVPLAYVQWIALMVVGVGLGFVVNVPFALTMLALWVMGCIYNIPPIRSKDLPYLDVLSESINNPLRMLAGWYMTGTAAFAPTSLLVSYWMVGCYFMAIKRYAEYRDIGDPARAAAYRKSFGYYTLERLLGVDHVLRLGRDALPRRLRHALPARADPGVPARRAGDGDLPRAWRSNPRARSSTPRSSTGSDCSWSRWSPAR